MAPKLDPKKARLSTSIAVEGILYAMAYAAETKQLYGAGSGWSVHQVDLTAKKPAAKKKWTHHDNYVSSLVLLDGVLISAGYDGRLIWTDLKSEKKVREVKAHEGWTREVIASPDQKQLISVGDDMKVCLWDAGNGKLLRSLEGHQTKTPQGFSTALYAVALSPDGKTIASGDRIGEVCLWEAGSGKLIRRLQAKEFYTYDPVKRSRSIGGIRSLCFSPDGKQLAIGGIGKVTNVDGFVGPCRVEVWDWSKGKRTFLGQDRHKAVLNHVTFHPTESILIAGGGGDSGGILAFWDLKKTEPIHKAKPKGHLQHFILDTDSQRILAAGHGGFQIWSIQ